MNGIGGRIREIRNAQRKSLSEIAARANISAATLSRIETEKQGVDISLFLLLAKVLRVAPAELLGEPFASDDGNDPVVQKVASMKADERARLWNSLAAMRRHQRARRHEAGGSNVGVQLEELLAQIDYLRQEVDAMRHRAGRKKR